MWCLWTALLLATCALVAAEGVTRAESPAPATTRAPPRTLDRQAAELAWRSWLQSPESGNQNAPPRRITTKSLFITPLVCPKGQRLDSNGCVQVVTVNKDEHERILLEQLNALFTSAPSGDVVYDYGDEEPGPLQLSIPIGVDPQAAPLQAQEPSAQAHEVHPSFIKVDKKDEENEAAAGLVAELELLQLQHAQKINETNSGETTDILNHNVLFSLDKPKRDSPVNKTRETINSDEGQKELVYGQVNIDPVLYHDIESQTEVTTSETYTEIPTVTTITTEDGVTEENIQTEVKVNNVIVQPLTNSNRTNSETNKSHTLKKDGDKTKLNPENDYMDIGEAIKLISRYAEVTTDDNFGKDQKKSSVKDDNILGTRTKLQYRRKPKPTETSQETVPPLQLLASMENSKAKMSVQNRNSKTNAYYRYPWPAHSPTPPPDYPFRNIQDYWPDRKQIGGVYNSAHENPRRHHHTITYNYYKPHSAAYTNYPGPYLVPSEIYPRQLPHSPYRSVPHQSRPMRSHTTNQDLYSLLGLRHWFSSEGNSKR